MTNPAYTIATALAAITDKGYAVQIGQIPPAVVRQLNKRDDLERYRGHWNTGSPACGLGPLKTCWRMRKVFCWIHPDRIAASWKRRQHDEYHRGRARLGIKILREARDAGQLNDEHRVAIAAAFRA